MASNNLEITNNTIKASRLRVCKGRILEFTDVNNIKTSSVFYHGYSYSH